MCIKGGVNEALGTISAEDPPISAFGFLGFRCLPACGVVGKIGGTYDGALADCKTFLVDLQGVRKEQ